MGVDAESASINEVAPESQPGLTALPSWFIGLGWFALLGTVFSSLLPDAESLFNISSGLGLIALIIYVIQFRQASRVSKSVFIAFIIFFVVALLTAIIPNYSALPDFEPMSNSFHDLWNTVQAATAAALCLVLIRRRSDLTNFLMLFTLVILMITLASPMVGFLKHGLLMRLTGTKGGANRYAIMLLVSSLPIWMLILKGGLRKPILPQWARVAGWIVIISSLIMQFRHQIINAIESGKFSTEEPINFLGFILIFIFFSLVPWCYSAKTSISYSIICWFALVGIYFNLYLSGSRMTLLLAILILLSIGIWKFRKRWPHCLVAALILIGIVGGAAYLHRGEDLSLEKIQLDFKVRQFIWQGASEIFEQHPVLGCGYGTESFYRNWPPLHPPETEDFVEFNHIFSHAHNLWRHLLATQGVLGFIAFHLLWLTVVLQFTRPVRTAESLPNPEKSTVYATLFNTPIIFIAFIGMLLLQVNGILTLPLQGCNEILYWLVGALGLAGLNIYADNK